MGLYLSSLVIYYLLLLLLTLTNQIIGPPYIGQRRKGKHDSTQRPKLFNSSSVWLAELLFASCFVLQALFLYCSMSTQMY